MAKVIMFAIDIVGPPSNNDDCFNCDFYNNKRQKVRVQ